MAQPEQLKLFSDSERAINEFIEEAGEIYAKIYEKPQPNSGIEYFPLWKWNKEKLKSYLYYDAKKYNKIPKKFNLMGKKQLFKICDIVLCEEEIRNNLTPFLENRYNIDKPHNNLLKSLIKNIQKKY